MKKNKKPRKFDRNLIVIGAGAAGLVSAYIAAAVKAKVTLIEASRMGGDCLNTGCVPSKTLIQCARVAQQVRGAAEFGVHTAQPQVDFPAVMRRVREAIARIEPHDSAERYAGLGVEVIAGRARLIDPWTVEIALNSGGRQILTARAVILATGAEPVVPDLPGLARVPHVTSDTLWDKFTQLQQLPRRLLVLGGGAVGCELAQAFARLGSQVTLVEMAERLLPMEDREASMLVAESLRADGVRLFTGRRVSAFETLERGDATVYRALLANGEPLDFDQLLLALGRRPRVSGFGLEELGIAAEEKLVLNEYLQTRYPHILAAGDLAGPYQFTHMAAHQAWYAAVNGLFGDLKKFRVDYSLVPRAVFVDPELASVGLSEQQARERQIPFEVTRYGLDDLDRAIVDGKARGFVKVLTPPGRDKILGVTIVGEQAAELIAEFVLAMKHGLGLNKLLGTIHIYPSMAEANKYLAGAWKRAHAPEKLLRLLRRFHDWRRG